MSGSSETIYCSETYSKIKPRIGVTAGLFEKARSSDEDCNTMEEQHADAIATMTKWIKNVGVPGLEKLDTLKSELYKKVSDLRKTLFEIDCLKDMNEELQEKLSSRPTKQQYESELERTARLVVELRKVEQDLFEKEQLVSEVSKNAKQMHRRGEKLKCCRDELAVKLRKMKDNYEHELDHAFKQNQRLAKTLVEKDDELANLADELQRMENVSNEEKLDFSACVWSSSESIIEENFSSTPILWSAEPSGDESYHEDLAAETGVFTLSGDCISTTPEISEAPSPSQLESKLTRLNFLGFLQGLSSKVYPRLGFSRSIDLGESQSWKDFRRCLDDSSNLSWKELLDQLVNGLSE